jgi:hypothetical protein
MAGARKPGPQCSYSDWDDIDNGTMCRAQSPTPGPQGHRSAGYEFGDIRRAVRGSSYIAVADASYVAMPDVKYRTGTAMPSHKKLSGDLLSWFAGKLSALDKALKGNARQSWGMMIWGEGSGEDSTATKASAGAKLWYSAFDFAQFMEIMGLILDVIPEGTSYRASVKSLRDELNAKNPEKVAAFVKKSVEELEEILDAAEENIASTASPFSPFKASPATSPVSPFFPALKRAPTRQPPAIKKAAKFQTGQWVAHGGSGNIYVKIKYSDGSIRYVLGSRSGQQDIANPGPMLWRPVS